MVVNKAFRRFFLEDKIKYCILYGGAASSKSYTVTQKIIVKCIQSPRKVLVLRKTGVSLNDSVIALFLDILSSENIPYSYNKTERTIKFAQSIVLFKPMEDPERIKSIAGVTDIWLEEATEFSPDDFTQLILRLRVDLPDSQVFISFNPVSKANWVYRYFFDKSSPDYFLRGKPHLIMKSTYRDNAFLPASYVSELESLKVSSPYYFTVYAEGEWGSLGKLIFPEGSWSIGSLDIPSTAKHIYGLDLGYVDPSALVCCAVWNNTLYIYDEYVRSETLCKDISNVIKTKCASSPVFADCAAAAQIAEIQKYGCYNVRPCVKKPGDVLAGIDQIKAYNLVISPKCENTIKDFRLYSWKKDPKTGLYLDEPERGSGETHQNCCDAVRYALQGLGSSIKSVNIKLHKGL